MNELEDTKALLASVRAELQELRVMKLEHSGRATSLKEQERRLVAALEAAKSARR